MTSEIKYIWKAYYFAGEHVEAVFSTREAAAIVTSNEYAVATNEGKAEIGLAWVRFVVRDTVIS